jgi:hypothetical protein
MMLFRSIFKLINYISRKQIEKIVLADILAKARYVIENEEEARQEFLRRKETEGTKPLMMPVNSLQSTGQGLLT